MKKIKNNDIFDSLYSQHRFGIKPGLERISYILNSLNNPQNDFKSIHIAGTNGKGSTAAILSSILIKSGKKIGLYTSPHLLHFSERFRINGRKISNDMLLSLIEEIMPIGEKINATFFEITTAIAFKYFSDEKVDLAIIEAGMGGLNDATNVLNPLLSIITKIDFDHKEYLGNTLEEIAKEKAGIIKHNVPVIISKNNINLINIFKEEATKKNTELVISDNQFNIEFIKLNDDFQMIIKINEISKTRIIFELPGYHQLDNLNTALLAINFLKNKFKITKKSIKSGIESVKDNINHRGRIDVIKRDPYLIIDVSHNPNSIKSLVETIKLNNMIDNWKFIFGVMSDKNSYEMLKYIKELTSDIILTKAQNDRSESIKNLKRISQELEFKNITTYNKIEEAIVNTNIKAHNTIIAGSFYVIEEALKILNLEQIITN